jgi:ATP-dependent phosphofructokinase / diphosphate-dependent phosphofructokinase
MQHASFPALKEDCMSDTPATGSTSFSGPRQVKRVAFLFAGGPAPAANAVISTGAASFRRHDIEAVGILHGYSHLVEYGDAHPMQEGRDYIVLDQNRLKRSRNTRGIMIGTSRTNPGKDVSRPEHLCDPRRTAQLRLVHQALSSLDVDALISIGGDDTLKTANKLKRFQDYLPPGARRIAVVHVPKTIDNDYRGIDFTFGYFTAVEFLASEIRNLLADAESSRMYFLVETMGRSAGWLAYGASIAGEASVVLSVEDLTANLLLAETISDPATGATTTRKIMDIPKVVDMIVRPMLAREREGKEFGVIVVAEGLAQYMPARYLQGVTFDDHGNISLSQTNLARNLTKLIEAEYERCTGKKRRVTGLQLGYEARCALPHAFDVILGSQLGVGAYRAVVENRLDGVLVSVSGQLNLSYVPFDDLIDPDTLLTVVRLIQPGSDFQKLARFLENYPHD